MKAFAGRLLQVLGTAMILMFFSEYFFLNEAPLQTVLAALAGGGFQPLIIGELLLYYCLFAYIFLIVLDRFSVSSIAGLLLAGALYGWAAEALVVPVAHEAPPISWIWTSASWHPLIDVIIGWYLLRLAMRRLSAPKLVLVFALTGAGWAIWAPWLGAQMTPTPAQFSGYALATGAFWIIGMVLADRAAARAFVATMPEVVLVGAVAGLLLLATGLIFLPWSLGLLVLIGVSFAALARARRSSGPRLSGALAQPPAPGCYALAVVMPVSAAGTYWAIVTSGLTVPSEDITLLLVAAGGFGFVWALWRCWRAEPAAKLGQSSD